MKKRDPLQKTKAFLERVAQKTYKTATPAIFGNVYFYVFGWTKGKEGVAESKKVILGPFYSEREAERELAMLEDGEVFGLDTRDITRATRCIKAELMSRGEDPDEVLRRALHQKGLEREAKRER
jgi:hypothetical protein